MWKSKKQLDEKKAQDKKIFQERFAEYASKGDMDEMPKLLNEFKQYRDELELWIDELLREIDIETSAPLKEEAIDIRAAIENRDSLELLEEIFKSSGMSTNDNTLMGFVASIDESPASKKTPGYGIQVLKWLLNKGFSIDQPGAGGLTPLMAATTTPNFMTFRYLLENGADINITINGMNILDCLMKNISLIKFDCLIAITSCKDLYDLQHFQYNVHALSEISRTIVQIISSPNCKLNIDNVCDNFYQSIIQFYTQNQQIFAKTNWEYRMADVMTILANGFKELMISTKCIKTYDLSVFKDFEICSIIKLAIEDAIQTNSNLAITQDEFFDATCCKAHAQEIDNKLLPASAEEGPLVTPHFQYNVPNLGNAPDYDYNEDEGLN